MYSSTPNFDGNERIQDANSSFKRNQIRVFVRKYSKVARFHPEAYAGRNVLFGGFEPGVPLCLWKYKYVYWEMKVKELEVLARHAVGAQ